MQSSSAGSSKARAVVRLRPIEAADRAPLEAILAATGSFSDDELRVALELIDLTLAKADDYQIVVAESERSAGRWTVAGYACWGPTPLTDAVFDLYWIAVDPMLHGSGVGRKLLQHAEWEVREVGGRMLLIETGSAPTYDATRAFYLRTGYREVARVPDFYRLGDDKVIYLKRTS